AMQDYVVTGAWTVGRCVWPVLAAVVIAAFLTGGIQSRFRTASEALGAHWDRLNPAAGLKKIFSMRSTVAAGLGLLKLAVIFALTWHVIRAILNDPIFSTTVALARIGEF